MLRHKNKEKFEDFIWHWFLVVGYEKEEHDIFWKMYKDFLKTIYGREKFRYNR